MTKLFNKKLSEKGIIHFWETPNYNWVILKDKFRDKLTKEFMKKHRTITNGSRLSGIARTTLGRVIRKERKRIRIDFLIKLVKLINNKISLEEVEENIIWIGYINSQGVVNPKLPFNFNSRSGTRFLAAIANDGWISRGLYYSNSNNKLREFVRRDALYVFGGNKNTIKDWIKENDQYLSFPSIMRDVLMQITEFKGIKSEIDPSVPPFILKDKEFMCGWVEQTIADEGHVRFFPVKYRRSITWRRSIDVSKELSRFNFDKDEISIRKLPKEVQRIISQKSSNLINDECYILNKLGITFRTYNLGIYLTKKGKIRTRLEIQITKRKNLIKLRKMITIPDSDKENKFTEMMQSFVRHKEPLRVEGVLKSIYKSKGHISSLNLKKEMNYKNLSTVYKWLNFFEKQGFIKKIKYKKDSEIVESKMYVIKNG